MSFLHALKSKSPQVKSRIALVLTLFITGIIALVWSSTVPARLARMSQAATTETSDAKSKLTDLVANVSESVPGGETSDAETSDDTISATTDVFTVESPLDALARERYDPTPVPTSSISMDTEVVVTPPIPREESVLPPAQTSTEPTETTIPLVLTNEPTPTPTDEPRVILIGTTTRPSP